MVHGNVSLQVLRNKKIYTEMWCEIVVDRMEKGNLV